jgi:hypothetical protein
MNKTLAIATVLLAAGILGTYETILVVLAPDQQPLPPTTIISQITIEESLQCPNNTTLVNGNCVKPTPEPCPRGTTGVPPNCEPICPAGEDCPCPEGTTGTPPNCIPIEECPEGTTGTPPNCIPIEGGGGEGGIGGGGFFNGEGGEEGGGEEGGGEEGGGEEGGGEEGDVPSMFG